MRTPLEVLVKIHCQEAGVIAEVVTTGLSTSQNMSPFVMGGNLNDPPDTTMYVSIQNLSGSSQSITAYLTILQLEQEYNGNYNRSLQKKYL